MNFREDSNILIGVVFYASTSSFCNHFFAVGQKRGIGAVRVMNAICDFILVIATI